MRTGLRRATDFQTFVDEESGEAPVKAICKV